MPGLEITYHSADTIEDDNNHEPQEIPQELLHGLDLPSLPLFELKIKIGCPLILLRNLDPTKGLCNGTRMILLAAYHRILEVLIIGGDHHGEKAFIPRIILKPSSRQFPFTFR